MTSVDSDHPAPPGALPGDVGRAAHPEAPATGVHQGLLVAAAYAWRVMVIAVAVYLLFAVLAKLTLVAVAVFVGLVITALLLPLLDRFSARIPRGLAVSVALGATIVAIAGTLTFVADSVAGQTTKMSAQFTSGLNEIERSVAGAPFRIRVVDLTQVGQQIRTWVTQNGGSLAGSASAGQGSQQRFSPGSRWPCSARSSS